MRETSQPVVNKVAIIGAGPGGLATAIALRKKGIDAHLYERAREFCPAGAGLALRVNGIINWRN
ncbi:MAG: NAD(P)-binding protein [Okeania sp. SIO3B3]|nr:NAD(P)-binding protein [Okeania sp. SIO3B3]